MSANRFEYAEVCPTCEKAGVKNPDNDKIFSLGYDIDEGQICCANGHTFEQLPSEATGPVSNGALLESATEPLRSSATSGQDSTENEVNSGSENGAAEAPSSHSLESQIGESDVSYEQADSDRLALISKSLDTPEKVAADINDRAAKMSDERRAEADRETQRIAARIRELERTERLSPAVKAEVDAVVANGAVLSNGDAIFAITVPERWLSAIQAEAENQNMTPSAYLQDWFDRALESEWVSSYAQTVAGSPR